MNDSLDNVLSQEERTRYARHLVLPEVGAAGQKKLKHAKVLLIGTGGLGSPAAMYLAAAGVGKLGLVDFDRVEASNLQRQILHATKNVGKSKLISAVETLQSLNPFVEVEAFETKLGKDNALEIIEPFDIVVDGSDNFPTRYLVNDACVLLGKPNIYGSIYRFEGQASVFFAKEGPCYRCLYPEPPSAELVPNCAEGGVLGVLPGIIGTIQANETIKQILQLGETLSGRLLVFDALRMKFRELTLKRDKHCPVCGLEPTIKSLVDYEPACAVKETEEIEVSPRHLKAELDRGTELFLLDVREPEEYAISNLGGHLIPLRELPRRLSELDAGKQIVVYCHHGMRSLQALYFLKEQGYTKIRNLTGGIDQWTTEVDPSLPRY